MSIPKIIHQTVADKNNVHPLLQENFSKIRALNPAYEHCLYDDADIIEFIQRAYGSEILKLYERINPVYGAARADFFRYLLLYKMGGIYLDAKSTIIHNLDGKLRPEDTYLLSHWRNQPGEAFEGWGMHPGCGPRGEYQQWHIIAEKQHNFLLAVIEKVIANIINYDHVFGERGRLGVIKCTGPVAYSSAILGVENKFKSRLVDIEELGFRYSVLEDKNNLTLHRLLFDNHYSEIQEPVILNVDESGKQSFRDDGLDHKNIFNKIYEKNIWDCGSGPGSKFENSIKYIEFLQAFIKTNHIKSVVDIGCGDWQFSQHINWQGVYYTGIDVSNVVLENTKRFSKQGIEFLERNVLFDELPSADMVIIKDVLQHWSNEDILNFLPKLKKYPRVLITNGAPGRAQNPINRNIRTGDFRPIDLSAPPFCLSGSYIFWYQGDEEKFVYFLSNV
ncbi:MAG: glycosyltransferase [Acidocella sp.]|nr:glycosyltransferase [Acidocella sp.]